MKQYHKTTITITVISRNPLVKQDKINIADSLAGGCCAAEIGENGSGLSMGIVESTEQLTDETLLTKLKSDELYHQGIWSKPSFFGLRKKKQVA